MLRICGSIYDVDAVLDDQNGLAWEEHTVQSSSKPKNRLRRIPPTRRSRQMHHTVPCTMKLEMRDNHVNEALKSYICALIDEPIYIVL